jgi:peroxiredoxin
MGRGIRTVLLFAVGVFLLAWGVALAQGKEASPPDEPSGAFEKVPLLGVGAAAPGFRLADVIGADRSYGGEGSRKPLLLAFFSVFCEPCRAELSILQKIREKYGGGSVDVAAVSLDGEALKTTVAGFAKQEGYTFRVLLDEVTERQTFRVAETYRVTEMPTLYLMDRRGRVAFAGTGRVAEETLVKAVQAAITK